jgi:hypothetical protein
MSSLRVEGEIATADHTSETTDVDSRLAFVRSRLGAYVKRTDELWRARRVDDADFVYDFLDRIKETDIRAGVEKLLLQKLPGDIRKAQRTRRTIPGRDIIIQGIGWRDVRRVLCRLNLDDWPGK